MAQESQESRIARVNALVESMFQQGRIGDRLARVNAALPEGRDLDELYAWCDAYKRVPDEQLPGFFAELEGKLRGVLSGDDVAVDAVLDMYGLQECVRGYIDASVNKAVGGSDFSVLRQSQLAQSEFKKAFMALSGLGEQQSNLWLQGFCAAVDAMTQAAVAQRHR